MNKENTSQNQDDKKAYFQLHLSVLFWGFTAILGKVISVSALTLVWWRMVITSVCLFFILKGLKDWKKVSELPRNVLLKVMGIGWLVALHWLAFYGAIKLANASVAVVCIATMSLFTAIIEPLINRTKFQWYEVGIGIVIIPAMMLIFNNLGENMTMGFVVGIIAAVLSSCFSILNKIMLKEVEPMAMTFLEIGSGGLLLTLLMPLYLAQNPDAQFIPTQMDWIWLFVLSIFCTILPYVMSLFALQKLSAFTTVLAVNLEPVYGVLLAYFLLHEDRELNLQFYIGVAIIVGSVMVHPFLRKKCNK
jgi:drug/metabolite transporter (DMT)-like permease